MNHYTIYDLATGRPVQVGCGLTDPAYLEVPPGHGIIIGQRAEAGQMVDPVTLEIVAAPLAEPDMGQRRAAMSISPRQMILGMLANGWITAEEAVASATAGTMPAAVAAIVALMQAPDQVTARVTWARMTVVLRNDPMVSLLATAQGISDEDVDAFFAACATL